MKKVVLKVDIQDDKTKIKTMKTVSCLAGVDSISMDMKNKTVTVTGDIDPVEIVSKLRKLCPTDIISVGPAKEPEKKKEESKKQDNEDQKKGKKDEDEKMKEQKADPVAELVMSYKAYNPQLPTYYYANARSAEEDPNACCIS